MSDLRDELSGLVHGTGVRSGEDLPKNFEAPDSYFHHVEKIWQDKKTIDTLRVNTGLTSDLERIRAFRSFLHCH